MFSPFETMMAGRYLRARKAEGFVSVIAAFSFLGIMLGVATLIIVMSVMNGFRAELITRILGLNGHVNVYSQNGPLTDYNALKMKLAEVPGVTSVAPVIEAQVLMTINGYANGALVRGMTFNDFVKKPIVSQSIKEGSIADFHDNNVAIGRIMAEKLHLGIGDEITLLSPKGKVSPFGTIPRTPASFWYIVSVSRCSVCAFPSNPPHGFINSCSVRSPECPNGGCPRSCDKVMFHRFPKFDTVLAYLKE